MRNYDLCVVGGGIVGISIAFGEVRRGKRVMVVDGARADRKASYANFGLVWAQGKGKGLPQYQALTQKSDDAWSDFALQIQDVSGVGFQFEKAGGLVFCLGEDEFEARKKHLSTLQETSPSEQDWEMLGRNETQHRAGDVSLGKEVVGASYCRRDGALNPLELVRSLNKAIERLGGDILREAPVTSIKKKIGGWHVATSTGPIECGEVVVAAGLGSKKIAEDLGFNLPIKADKGQILVTERRPVVMSLPASGIRQNQLGSFMIGATHEGDQNDRSTILSGAKLAQRAIRIIPDLEHVPIVRQWAGYRIITPDTYPVYLKPEKGLTFAVCHSGITLAAFHASDWLEDTKVFEQFSPDRFARSDKIGNQV